MDAWSCSGRGCCLCNLCRCLDPLGQSLVRGLSGQGRNRAGANQEQTGAYKFHTCADAHRLICSLEWPHFFNFSEAPCRPARQNTKLKRPSVRLGIQVLLKLKRRQVPSRMLHSSCPQCIRNASNGEAQTGIKFSGSGLSRAH